MDNIFHHYLYPGLTGSRWCLHVMKMCASCCVRLFDWTTLLSPRLLPPPSRFKISREFLPDDYLKSYKRLPVLPSLRLRWPGGSAAGTRSGTVTCLPVWRPAWTAHARTVPHIQENQPGWWKVGSFTIFNLSVKSNIYWLKDERQ